MAEFPTTREMPLDPKASALLFIDVQNFSVRRDGGEFKDVPDVEIDEKYAYYFERLASVAIPNMQRLQAAFRAAGIEVLYTTIESLTKDGRDRSLDYKITGFHVPKGSWDGKVIDEIAPGRGRDRAAEDLVQRLRLDPHRLSAAQSRRPAAGAFAGSSPTSAWNSAIRDACDLGYLVTLVPDACATYSQERHDNTLRAIKGYCRQVSTSALIAEIGGDRRIVDGWFRG